jgi:hypothetical protein
LTGEGAAHEQIGKAITEGGPVGLGDLPSYLDIPG